MKDSILLKCQSLQVNLYIHCNSTQNHSRFFCRNCQTHLKRPQKVKTFFFKEKQIYTTWFQDLLYGKRQETMISV